MKINLMKKTYLLALSMIMGRNNNPVVVNTPQPRTMVSKYKFYYEEPELLSTKIDRSNIFTDVKFEAKSIMVQAGTS
jgi:hypothetical protein